MSISKFNFVKLQRLVATKSWLKSSCLSSFVSMCFMHVVNSSHAFGVCESSMFSWVSWKNSGNQVSKSTILTQLRYFRLTFRFWNKAVIISVDSWNFVNWNTVWNQQHSFFVDLYKNCGRIMMWSIILFGIKLYYALI